MSNWEKVKLEDICINITDGVHNTVKDTINEQYYLLSCKNIKNGNVCIDKRERTISKETLERLRKRTQLSKGDILLSSVGTIGETAIVKEEYPPYEFQRSVAIFKPNQRHITPNFLYYSLRYKKKKLRHLAEGAVQQCLFINSLKQFEISIPPLGEQKKIAKILGALDDKIELNNKINQNLEAQAQAIFKSWFVDFDPFKNGNFVDSELGKIPEGWRVERLGAVCECVLGGTPSRSHKEYWEGNIPWINSGKTNEFRVISPSEFISAEGLKKSATKLLPKKTTILAITGATLGQVSLLEIDACANQSVVGILENNLLPYEYIYMYVSHNIEKIISHQTGGAQQHINKDNVKNFHIILPPQCVLKRYTNTVAQLYSEITNLVFQSHHLSQLRDTLLPKLMSGEMDVSDVAV